MNYEMQAQAIIALGGSFDFFIRMRKPSDWYASTSVDIKRGAMLESLHGDGKTPELAVNDLWNRMTNLTADCYLVLDSGHSRRSVKWNGFMWEDIKEAA